MEEAVGIPRRRMLQVRFALQDNPGGAAPADVQPLQRVGRKETSRACRVLIAIKDILYYLYRVSQVGLVEQLSRLGLRVIILPVYYNIIFWVRRRHIAQMYGDNLDPQHLMVNRQLFQDRQNARFIHRYESLFARLVAGIAFCYLLIQYGLRAYLAQEGSVLIMSAMNSNMQRYKNAPPPGGHIDRGAGFAKFILFAALLVGLHQYRKGRTDALVLLVLTAFVHQISLILGQLVLSFRQPVVIGKIHQLGTLANILLAALLAVYADNALSLTCLLSAEIFSSLTVNFFQYFMPPVPRARPEAQDTSRLLLFVVTNLSWRMGFSLGLALYQLHHALVFCIDQAVSLGLTREIFQYYRGSGMTVRHDHGFFSLSDHRAIVSDVNNGFLVLKEYAVTTVPSLASPSAFFQTLGGLLSGRVVVPCEELDSVFAADIVLPEVPAYSKVPALAP